LSWTQASAHNPFDFNGYCYIDSCFLINRANESFISVCLGTGDCLPFLGFA
jgi:hypothetical protein